MQRLYKIITPIKKTKIPPKAYRHDPENAREGETGLYTGDIIRNEKGFT
jgi:hypothetical protein